MTMIYVEAWPPGGQRPRVVRGHHLLPLLTGSALEDLPAKARLPHRAPPFPVSSAMSVNDPINVAGGTRPRGAATGSKAPTPGSLDPALCRPRSEPRYRRTPQDQRTKYPGPNFPHLIYRANRQKVTACVRSCTNLAHQILPESGRNGASCPDCSLQPRPCAAAPANRTSLLGAPVHLPFTLYAAPAPKRIRPAARSGKSPFCFCYQRPPLPSHALSSRVPPWPAVPLIVE